MQTRTKSKDTVHVKGFYRLQITEDGPHGKVKVVGDTGWKKNLVVNLGFQDYLVKLLGAQSGSKQISHVALGTGGAPSAADTSLAGELTNHSAYARVAPTVAVVSSKTLRFTGTFNSSVVTANANISNIGLINTSSGGTIFAGNTYTSSTLATNQNVNITYEIRFS